MKPRALKLSGLRYPVFINEDDNRKKLFHLRQKLDRLSSGYLNTTSRQDQSEKMELEREMEEVFLEIGLQGMTMKDLAARKSRLVEIISMLPPGSGEYQEYMVDLRDLYIVEIVRKSQFKNIDLKWKKKSK